MPPELFVFMPVYNEAGALESVVEEWTRVLRREVGDFEFYLMDDGSTDATPRIAAALAERHPEVRVVRRPNGGYSAICLEGYRLSLERGSRWAFQLDSDGQCDPVFFSGLWGQREAGGPVFGHRAVREDGCHRVLLSAAARLVALAATGTWIRDGNVPYRLLPRETLARAFPLLHPRMELLNIVLAYLCVRDGGVRWVPIRFRRRRAGQSNQAFRRLPLQAARLYRELKQASRHRKPGATGWVEPPPPPC